MRNSDLDDLFAEARTRAPVPSDALLARVMADADAHQPRPVPLIRTVAPRRSRWSLLLSGLGGGGALAGLATATLAGVWIGFAQPAPVVSVAEALWQGETDSIDIVDLQPSLDLIPSLDGFMAEG